jgi:hypothetical protein
MVKTYSLLRSSLRTELPARASEATMVGSSASATDLLAGMAAPAALEQEEAKKLLHDIADRFKFQHEIADFLLTIGVRSIQDFQNCVTSKEAIASEIIGKMSSETSFTDSKTIQIARLRMAWESTFKATEAAAKKAAALDDDADLLPEGDLTALEKKWWLRYKFNPDQEQCPDDYVVTTAARQLKSRRIIQPDFLSVETLYQQKLRSKATFQIASTGGKSIEIVDSNAAETPRPRRHNFDNYYLGVELWAMAWAKAGIDAVPHPPEEPAHAGSDSSDYVIVPWEVVKKWLDRAHKQAKKVPENIRLEWLENRVEADIRIWTEEFRLQTGKTLGKIISQVYTQTAASWYYDVMDRTPTKSAPPGKPDRGRQRSSSRHRGNSGSRNDRRRRDRDSPERPRRPSQARKASRMRNGDRICKDWNDKNNGCSEPCPKGQKHVCNIVTIASKNRVCGMANHRACNHKFKEEGKQRGRSRKRSRGRSRGRSRNKRRRR